MKSSYYAEYAAVQKTHWWYLARAEILETVLRRSVAVDRTQRILDLGCGPGGLRPMLASYGRLVSTDFTFEALNFCKEQKLDNLVAADAMKLPFGSSSFDVACAFDVIEHLSDDSCAMSDLHRVLKPGGILVLTVPAYQWLWGRQDIISHHFRRYNATRLRALISRQSFQILELTYFNTFLFPPIAAIRLIFRALRLNRGKSSEEVASDLTMSRPGFANELLKQIFAAEKLVLARRRFSFGVSLLCVARKR